MAGVGASWGLAIGIVTVLWLSSVFNQPSIEITITLTSAYLTFLSAEVPPAPPTPRTRPSHTTPAHDPRTRPLRQPRLASTDRASRTIRGCCRRRSACRACLPSSH